MVSGSLARVTFVGLRGGKEGLIKAEKYVRLCGRRSPVGLDWLCPNGLSAI